MTWAFQTFAENQMVLNKWVAFMYTVVGVKRSAAEGKTKEATTGGDEVSSLLQLKGESSLECEMCSVCLSSMEEGEEKRVLPCKHEFHRGCVDKWVSSCRKNCPICRFSMGEEERFQFHRREAFTEEMLIWFSSFHIAGF